MSDTREPNEQQRAMVARTIAVMRAHAHAALNLEDLADVAGLSPFHFSRVFRAVTQVPPGTFYAALRLEHAKRLLLTTDLSVTDVCFEMGYSSLGSFTTRFGSLVGVSPRRLRKAAAEFMLPRAEVRDGSGLMSQGALVLHGTIEASDWAGGLIWAGLFHEPIPQRAPVAGVRLLGPGPFTISGTPAGRYYMLAAALPFSQDPLTYLMPAQPQAVAAADRPIMLQAGVSPPPVVLRLRPTLPSDPPILTVVPFLLG